MKELLVMPLSNYPEKSDAELVLQDDKTVLLRYRDDGVESESERYIYLFTASEFETVKKFVKELEK